MQIKTGQRWDIFCRIVDNFGDIGVCWRLSQQLAYEHHFQIRLFIDDLTVASKIIRSLNCNLQSQIINQIEICRWPLASDNIKPAEVVLETFSCALPFEYIAAIQNNTMWLNLEYLSAESWVADFHARSSNNTKPSRHFYFPGFTEATGGLIRESSIFQQNQKFAHDLQLQSEFFNHLNLTQETTLKVSLFCYPHAPIHELLNALAASNQSMNCYVPASSILPKVLDFFGVDDNKKIRSEIASNSSVRKLSYKNLNLVILPFLSQTDYDRLLAICDINFVRGEDSWVRAIWAAKPFIWLPYLQTEDTHIKKLNAFLNRFYANGNATTKTVVDEVHFAWAKGNFTTRNWQNYLEHLPAIRQITLEAANQLATQTDLAAKLVIFLQKL